MSRPIAISLSPNVEKDDFFLALKTLFSPWKWFNQKGVESLELEFASIFGSGYKGVAINSGRSAEYIILKALNLGKGDEIAVQAFNCVAVPNSVLWVGATPLFIDIDESFNLDPTDLEQKINKRTKAIIVQHTFGIPADIDSIKKIAHTRKVALIEDCAHSMGAVYKGRKVGMFGDVSFFSFGRDKVLSSVFGGIILCSNQKLYKKIRTLRNRLTRPSHFWVFQQLLHPLFFPLILFLYNFGLGKLLLVFLQELGFLSKAVYEDERLSKKPRIFPSKMPGALAGLARNQLKKLEKFNGRRRGFAKLYFESLGGLAISLPPWKEGSIWLRFPIMHKRAKDLFSYAKERGILLGDWYRGIISPSESLELVKYERGSCPLAEMYSETVVNLPTYPLLTGKQARKVVEMVKKWISIE